MCAQARRGGAHAATRLATRRIAARIYALPHTGYVSSRAYFHTMPLRHYRCRASSTHTAHHCRTRACTYLATSRTRAAATPR